MPAEPVYFYGPAFERAHNTGDRGNFRFLELHGLTGVNATSIHTAFEIPEHNLGSDSGSLALWFFSLEELSPFADFGNMRRHNPHIKTYPFLSDSRNPQDFDAASFKLIWDAGWHPNLLCMFASGNLYEEAYRFPHRALVTANHFTFRKWQWYQLSLTWDHPKGEYRLYVNGIHVGSEDQFYPHRFHRDPCGKTLYLGNPTLCVSSIAFYDQVLDEAELHALYERDAPRVDPYDERELRRIYKGASVEPFSFTPDVDWVEKLCVDLKQPEHLDAFHLQGDPVSVSVTEEGVLVETVNEPYSGDLLGRQVYLWTQQVFEGDLYVEYEFRTLCRGGLSLLITQASGMNREDFMKDYPLRKEGNMTMVCWQDVRNYHWEYYREMADVRNDVASNAMMKNPFMYPLGYRCLDRQLDLERWHKLQFLQRGNHLIGALDGRVVIDAMDSGTDNNGPVLSFGRIAIRCMLRTKMLFRNLKIYNAVLPYTLVGDDCQAFTKRN